MADKKISQLPNGGAVQNGDLIPIARGAANYALSGLVITAKQDILTASNFGAFSDSLSAKTTPVNADTFNIVDSAAANVEKKLSWANIKATLAAYFGSMALQNANAVAITGGTIEGTPIGATTKAAGNFTDISATGNQTFTGSAKRILGDLSNNTRENRLSFETSTTNGNTLVQAIPNGTATISGFLAYGGSDADNSAYLQVYAEDSSHVGLNSSKSGTGTTQDLVLQIDGITKAKVNAADGKFNVDTLTASLLVGTDASKNLQSLSVATYPSLTEISYVKGVSSAIQTQINGKQNSLGYTAENVANKDASNGYTGLTLFKINFKNALNTFTSFFTNNNTAARTYTFQDRDGTIADNTDLASIVTNIISYTTPGTFSYTPTPGAKVIDVYMYGGGGGGGGGAKILATSACSGGGGGGAAAKAFGKFQVSSLTTPISITVGAGGAGGAGAVSNSSNGSNGSNGGASIFGSILRAGRGGFGQGGQNLAVSAGGGGGGDLFIAGDASGSTGANYGPNGGSGASGGIIAVTNGNFGNGGGGATGAGVAGAGGGYAGTTCGGGAGAGLAFSASAGQTGGNGGFNQWNNASTGGTAGNNASTITAPTVANRGFWGLAGTGGGGGGSSVTTAGNGASTFFGGGGGGGGSCQNDGTAGNGGAGGNGAVFIIEYF